MTRIYDFSLLCAACRRPGPCGWVYRCSQDREDLIEHAICRGEMTTFDLLGRHMVGQLKVRRGSPAARQDRLSFLGEISHEQMSSYRPDQVAVILRQREHVQAVIQLQRLRNDSTETINRRTYSHVFDCAPGPFDRKKPWVRSVQDECQYRICSRCRPGLADRAFLSLSAVAHGEIAPTAAVGYGFHILGERPIIDAEIVRRLGHPPDFVGRHDAATSSGLPMPSHSQSRLGQASFKSRESIRQLFEEPRSMPRVAMPNHDGSQTRTPDSVDLGSLKHSPRCRNLVQYSRPSNATDHGPISLLVLTPPPSPDPNKNGALAEKQGQTTGPDGQVAADVSSSVSSAPEFSFGGHEADRDSPPAPTGLGVRTLSHPPALASHDTVSLNSISLSEGPVGRQMMALSPPAQEDVPNGRTRCNHSPPHVTFEERILDEC